MVAVAHTLVDELPCAQNKCQENGVRHPFPLDNEGAEHQQTCGNVDAVDVAARAQCVVIHAEKDLRQLAAEGFSRDVFKNNKIK